MDFSLQLAQVRILNDVLVGIYFSGSNHYTSAGIVVRTTKINSNIKEAKATSFTPIFLTECP